MAEKFTISLNLSYSSPTKLPSLDEKISVKPVTERNMESEMKQVMIGMQSKVLRTCRFCGKTASNKRELFEFLYNRDCLYHRAPCCKRCFGIHYNDRRIKFLGVQIPVPVNPRKGICVVCGKTVQENGRQLSMHHDSYDPNNILADTRELCNECHTKFRWGSI